VRKIEQRKVRTIGLACALAALISLPSRAVAIQDDERFVPDAKAAEAFEAMVKHYRELPGVEINCVMQIEMEQDGQTSKGEKVEARLVRSGDSTGTLELRGFTCTIKNKSLWMVHESTEHSYYVERFDDSPYWPLLMSFQDLPFPHLAILWGEAEMPDLWMQLHSRTPMLVPTKVEMVEHEDGATERLITLSSPDATMVIHQNPRTKLIDRIEHEITGGMFVRDGAVLRSTYTYEDQVFENVADAPKIVFDTGGRQRVDFVAALVDRPVPEVAIGEMPEAPRDDPGAALEDQPAPAFDLPMLGGANVELSALKGQVVVLDFWATWCPPCRKALPSLHEVGAWVKSEELPVRIFAVNCWEHGDNDGARAKSAGDFWKSNNYSLPILMDHQAAAATAYGVQGIPTTVIIRSDGVVHAYHVGAPPNYVEWLQGEIKGALAALEGDGDGNAHGH